MTQVFVDEIHSRVQNGRPEQLLVGAVAAASAIHTFDEASSIPTFDILDDEVVVAARANLKKACEHRPNADLEAKRMLGRYASSFAPDQRPEAAGLFSAFRQLLAIANRSGEDVVANPVLLNARLALGEMLETMAFSSDARDRIRGALAEARTVNDLVPGTSLS